MLKVFENTIAASGSGNVEIRNTNTAVEWDIYQISCQCGSIQANCIVILYVNGAFLCATPQGSLDTATGPPDVVLGATDILVATWQNAIPGDPILVNIFYNENPVGTTYSTAH